MQQKENKRESIGSLRMNEIRKLCLPDLVSCIEEYIDIVDKGDMSFKEKDLLTRTYLEGASKVLDAVQRGFGWYDAIKVVKIASKDEEWLNSMMKSEGELDGMDDRSIKLTHLDEEDEKFEKRHRILLGEEAIDDCNWTRDDFLRHEYKDDIDACEHSHLKRMRKERIPEKRLQDIERGSREGMFSVFNAIIDAVGNRTLHETILELKMQAQYDSEYRAGMDTCEVK